MKHIKEWFEELPEPYRMKALFNNIGYKGFGVVPSLKMALILGFKFSSTMEGGEYWDRVLKMVETGVYYDLTPKKRLKIAKPVKAKKLKNVKAKVVIKKAVKEKSVPIKKTPKIKNIKFPVHAVKKDKINIQDIDNQPPWVIKVYSSMDEAIMDLKFKDQMK